MTPANCTYLGSGWSCSADFSPRRCFKKCSSNNDCDFSDYECFLSATNPELGGYCHWVAITGDPPDGFQLWSNSGGWYNQALADHLAYAHLQESLNAVVSHHVNDMGLSGGYNEADGPYLVDIHSQGLPRALLNLPRSGGEWINIYAASC